ncbi:MAG: glycosyltransferase family 2 protein [Treponemataceae bacterium]|nr:MAG: glycosyltransferase family 2 protein [Treponemataceae bacterium]
MLTLSLVVPCFNEAEVLPETAKRLAQKIEQLQVKKIISAQSSVVFVDDGSIDATWNLIEKYHTENPALFSGIKLSKNRGHQNALLCGLLTMKNYCDAAISIDADLQDDIEIIDKMIEKYIGGCEIVYGVRSDRTTDRIFKRMTAQGFYSFMRLLGADIVYNHADFRLMGKEALNALCEYREVNLFLRGIVPMLGYKTGIEYYARAERFAGESKYPLRKMLKFAFEGITSLSIKPIRMITWLGIVIFCVSVAMIIHFITKHYTGHTVTGWSSTIVSLWAIGGLILFSIGIVGEYIGKIYLETKQRPRYHIEKFLSQEDFDEK